MTHDLAAKHFAVVVVCVPVLLGWATGCRRNSNDRPSPSATASSASQLKDSRLTLGKKYTLAAPAAKGGDICEVICDRKGQVWAFLARFTALSYAKITDKGAEQLQEMPIRGWKFINRMKAAIDDSGNPQLIWSGFDSATGEALAAIRWDGMKWSEVQILDRLSPSTSIGNIDAMLDSLGNLHVVYNRPLEDREAYSVGSLVVDGQFPNKCFQVMLKGQHWTKPEATTGKGHYYVENLRLSRGQGGRMYLSESIEPFDTWERYPGYQIWDGQKWGNLTGVGPSGKDIYSGTTIADAWNVMHVWWQKGIGGAWQYSKTNEKQKKDDLLTASWETIAGQ